MVLENKLYNIVETENSPGKCLTSINLIRESGIFKGHFPGNPITPGVVIIAIAREILEKAVGHKLFIKTVPSVKYISVLSPQNTSAVYFDMTYNLVGNQIKTKVIVKDDTTIFVRMSLIIDLE